MSAFFTIRAALVDDCLEADQEYDFYSRLRLSDGTFKTTSAHRLDDVNARVQALLPDARPLRVLDVGASSALSSAEWSEHLRDAGIEHELVATDRTLSGRLACLGPARLLFEDSRPPHLLQADIGAVALPNASGSRWRNQLYRLIATLSRGQAAKGHRVTIAGARARRLVDREAGFQLASLDVFRAHEAALGPPFHVVRAANVLNRVYFDDDELRRAVEGVLSLAAPGGLLVVVRSHEDGSNHGGIYRVGMPRPALVEALGGGSEIDDIIQGAEDA